MKIKIYDEYNILINYLINNKIYYKNLIKNDDYFYLDISSSDIDKLSIFKYKVIKYYGFNGIKEFIKNNLFIIIGFLCGLILLYILSNTIFEIYINSNDSQINDILIKALNENDIKKYKRKKNYEELNSIKNKILSDYKDYFEWIEIEESGSKYIINITKRVKKNINDNNEYYDIVSLKDAKILKIDLDSGVLLKDINDYVKKGETIISSKIYKNDEFVSDIRASGRVYGEVWYTVNIEVPFNITEYISTGKIINHYYIDIFGTKMTILGKYDSSNIISSKKLILDKPYLIFDLYKETKEVYKYNTYKLSNKEAYDKAVYLCDDKIKIMLDNDEYIISKKVLKKEVFSSKLILEVFYKVYEDITDTLIVKEE